MRHYALILAAGAASRMGRCKALLPLPFPDGECCALERLARMYAFCGQRFVVTGHHAGLLEPAAPGWGLRAVRNPRPEDGMFSSIRAGLRAVLEQARAEGVEPEQGGVFVHPVDVPLTRRRTRLARRTSCRGRPCRRRSVASRGIPCSCPFPLCPPSLPMTDMMACAVRWRLFPVVRYRWPMPPCCRIWILPNSTRSCRPWPPATMP